ncbi:MAG TPA: hypothetical protein VIC86_13315 [Acidimicrobiales bacterium]
MTVPVMGMDDDCGGTGWAQAWISDEGPPRPPSRLWLLHRAVGPWLSDDPPVGRHPVGAQRRSGPHYRVRQQSS